MPLVENIDKEWSNDKQVRVQYTRRVQAGCGLAGVRWSGHFGGGQAAGHSQSQPWLHLDGPNEEPLPGGRVRRGAACTLASLLNWRAPFTAVRAVHAAVTWLGCEYHVALLALVKPLAGIGRHGLDLGVTALGTGQCRFHDHRSHLAAAVTVEGKPASLVARERCGAASGKFRCLWIATLQETQKNWARRRGITGFQQLVRLFPPFAAAAIA